MEGFMASEKTMTERRKETDWSLNPADAVALVLLILGAINWGLVGIFNYNIVSALFGNLNMLERAIYIIVGIAGIWSIIELSMHLHQHTFRRVRHVAVHH